MYSSSTAMPDASCGGVSPYPRLRTTSFDRSTSAAGDRAQLFGAR
jgi:hypothetical protein